MTENVKAAKRGENMRRFGTQGRVYPGRHYVVSRTEEIADFIARVEEGRYIVLFAPRQTGKTTFLPDSHLTHSHLHPQSISQFNSILKHIKTFPLPIFTTLSTNGFARKLSRFFKNGDMYLLRHSCNSWITPNSPITF